MKNNFFNAVFFNHSVPVQLSSKNREVWTYMLSKDIQTSSIAVEKENSVKVYPNPCSSMLHIASEKDLRFQRCTLYDATGQVVISQIIRNSSPWSIDISQLKNAMYFLMVGTETIKVIKL